MIQLSEDFFLRPLQLEDIDGDYPSWFVDKDVCKYNNHGLYMRPHQYYKRYIENLSTDSSIIVWAITDASSLHIGNISLQSISFVNRSAELAVIIGNQAYWGKGVATLAANYCLFHAFYHLNLNRVFSSTASSNLAMLAVFKKLRMCQEGVLREHLFLNGAYQDQHLYSILRSEFSSTPD